MALLTLLIAVQTQQQMRKVDPYGCAEVEVDSDDDQDGVNNSIDQCPGTPTGETVDNKDVPIYLQL